MPDRLSSSKILKGAFIAFYSNNAQPRTIVFQINPELIKRSILPPQSKKWPLKKANVHERISFVLSIDRNLGDECFVQNEEGISHGILPLLSAIELLVYPSSVINKGPTFLGKNWVLSRLNYAANCFRGTRSNALPYVCLMLGDKRVIPVRIQSIQIIEQAFDSALQPIRASAEIVMDALTEEESKRHPDINDIYKNYLNLKAMLSSSDV